MSKGPRVRAGLRLAPRLARGTAADGVNEPVPARLPGAGVDRTGRVYFRISTVVAGPGLTAKRSAKLPWLIARPMFRMSLT